MGRSSRAPSRCVELVASPLVVSPRLASRRVASRRLESSRLGKQFCRCPPRRRPYCENWIISVIYIPYCPLQWSLPHEGRPPPAPPRRGLESNFRRVELKGGSKRCASVDCRLSTIVTPRQTANAILVLVLRSYSSKLETAHCSNSSRTPSPRPRPRPQPQPSA